MTSLPQDLVQDLDTPAVLIDLDKVERNIGRAQALLDAAGIANRPHIKTHKIPELALLQIAHGAIGITCQKISEAEVFADAGCLDILIPYNIMGERKLARLKALADRIKVTVSADSLFTISGLARLFTDAARPLDVLVECDTGQHRCGVATPVDVVALAQAIDSLPGLRFAGMLTYPPRGKSAEVEAFLAAAKALCEAAGLAVSTISTGGTPQLPEAGEITSATEYRPGTYIYNDRSLVAKGLATWDDCALRIATTVVSRPGDDLAILDAGSKVVTTDLMGLEGYGYCPEYPGAKLRALNEEHGYLDLAGVEGARPRIGEIVSIIPNHACVVSNMVDWVAPHRGERAVAPLRVAGRGRLT
jgi:D-serine deaminase-like pyridoxal phosphate-dependent protein